MKDQSDTLGISLFMDAQEAPDIYRVPLLDLDGHCLAVFSGNTERDPRIEGVIGVVPFEIFLLDPGDQLSQ